MTGNQARFRPNVAIGKLNMREVNLRLDKILKQIRQIISTGREVSNQDMTEVELPYSHDEKTCFEVP
jgi:hypothetical protein